MTPNDCSIEVPLEAEGDEGALFTEDEVDDQCSATDAAVVTRWDKWIQVKVARPADLSDEVYVKLKRFGDRRSDAWTIPRTSRSEGQLRALARRHGWSWEDRSGSGPEWATG